MRIGIDVRFWDETGVGRYIRNLVYELSRLDHKNDYVIFALPQHKKQIKEIAGKKWSIIEAPIRWHTLNEQLQLPKLIKKHNVDLMHFPYFSIPVMYNGPFVVTIHDLILHHFPTGEASTLAPLYYRMKLAGYRYIMSYAARKSKKIIAVSNATRDEIVDHLPAALSKVSVIYEGVDQNISLPSQSAKIKNKFFLHVGNVYPHKNIDVLIQAFEKIHHDDASIRLIFVGKDDYFMNKLKKKVNGGSLETAIEFRGYVSDEELASLYSQTLATVIPSKMEGFSLPAIEAMKQQSLVLASDIPAHKEICSDAVLYFDPSDSEGLYELMKKLLTGKVKISPYIEKSMKRVKVFSWKSMARETLKLYESSTRL